MATIGLGASYAAWNSVARTAEKKLARRIENLDADRRCIKIRYVFQLTRRGLLVQILDEGHRRGRPYSVD